MKNNAQQFMDNLKNVVSKLIFAENGFFSKTELDANNLHQFVTLSDNALVDVVSNMFKGQKLYIIPEDMKESVAISTQVQFPIFKLTTTDTEKILDMVQNIETYTKEHFSRISKQPNTNQIRIRKAGRKPLSRRQRTRRHHNKRPSSRRRRTARSTQRGR